MQYGGFATRPGQLRITSVGLMLLASSTFVAALPAQQQQQDTTGRHGWGIVYSSPKSRAAAGTNAPSVAPTAPSASTAPAPSFSQPPATPTAPSQAPPTVLPTIRGSRYQDPASNSAPAPVAPPPNGVYAGDRPAYAAPATTAAAGTYDTIPPTAAGAGGVHLDELMSLHEYTATGLTSLQPQQVQVLEQWLAGYRAALIDSATRNAERTASTPSFGAPAGPAAPVTPAANPRALPPVNSHQVTGIRSGSRFVQIDDGSVWDVYPADQSETANWQVGDYVTVRTAQQAYGDFDHELVNAQRTGPVRAKFMGYARQ